MKYLKYELKGEKYINRFITTGAFTEPRRFQKAILNGRVNEWLKKGFSIHENPCRKEMIAVRKDELPPYYDISMSEIGQEAESFEQRRALSVYFPFGNIGYEESCFCYCPNYLRTYCYVDLEAEQDEEAVFSLETCGGVTVWNNDELVTDYIPFTRNMVKSTNIILPLRKGTNKLILCLDDLAERDTDYYFHLRYCSKQNLMMVLPVPDEVDIENVQRYEDILDLIYFDKESYISEEVSMTLPGGLIRDDFLKLIISHGEFVEKMNHQVGEDYICRYQLDAGQKHLKLMDAEDILPGYYNFMFEMEEGPIKIRRKVGNQIVWKKFLGRGSDVSKVRKTEFLDILIHHGSDIMPIKQPLILKKDMDMKKLENYICKRKSNCRTGRIVQIFILQLFCIFITVFMTGFPNSFVRLLKRQLWDIVIGLMSRVMMLCGFLVRIMHCCSIHVSTWQESYSLDRLFINSGKYGEEVCRHGRALLDKWFEEFFREFITEWNSSAYIPVDVHGLATIYNITEEGDLLHEKAKRALDMVCYSIAINEHKGAVMASFGRTYEKEMKGNYNAGTTSLLYLL